MDEQLKMKITGKLIELYGFQEGIRTAGVVIPGICSDFLSVLSKVKPGDRTEEEYRTEDGVTVIRLTGFKDKSGKIKIDDASVFRA